MRRAGLPTAPWVALDKAEGEGELPGRHIIKAVWEHASVGMEESGIVEGLGLEDLRRELERRSSRVKGGVFAEAFIDGREFNLSLLEGPDGPEVMPPAEIVFKDYPPEKWRVVDYKAKWVTGSFEYTHTPRSFRFGKKDQPLLEELRRLALECWRLFGLGGYARVDFRVDAEGRSWVLEINANPCLTPDCGFSAAAKQGGFDYKATIERIAQAALRGTRVEARL
ncbi:MAG: hypothetical protein NTW86_07115 [Candidatus Sumerlaeota bacterium]|nr:hypothetical protein [Candidatus Sumerlaeota bacterium]